MKQKKSTQNTQKRPQNLQNAQKAKQPPTSKPNNQPLPPFTLRGLIVPGGVALLFFVFALCFPLLDDKPSVGAAVLSALLLFVMSAFILRRVTHTPDAPRPDRQLSLINSPLLITAVSLLLGMVLRYFFFAHKSYDYWQFLEVWTNGGDYYGTDKIGFREGGWAYLNNPDNPSNYNLPYQYFLWFISRFALSDLYLIKLCSILFDLLTAAAAMRLADRFGASPMRKAAVGAAVWWFPTIWLNSAMWAQCDGIYAFFCLMALVYALEGKHARQNAALNAPKDATGKDATGYFANRGSAMCFIFAGIAFALKLQSVFFLPMLGVLLFAKRIEWKHIPLFPVPYLLAIFPAWISGMEGKKFIEAYRGQMVSYDNRLTLNSPSVFAFLKTPLQGDNDTRDAMANVGMTIAFLFVAALLILALVRREKISNAGLFSFALCMAVGIPFFLPYMHERYFYLAEVFCAVAAALIPFKRVPWAFLFWPAQWIAAWCGYFALLGFGKFNEWNISRGWDLTKTPFWSWPSPTLKQSGMMQCVVLIGAIYALVSTVLLRKDITLYPKRNH